MNPLKSLLVDEDSLANNWNQTCDTQDWQSDNDGSLLTYGLLILIAVFALSVAGCETVGTAFKSATGSCITVENLTSSEYVVVSSLGNGSRKEIRYGESKTHNVYLSGDQDEVDMTVAILRDGETLATESDEVWFQNDKSGCELKTVSQENQGGFDIDL